MRLPNFQADQGAWAVACVCSYTYRSLRLLDSTAFSTAQRIASWRHCPEITSTCTQAACQHVCPEGLCAPRASDSGPHPSSSDGSAATQGHGWRRCVLYVCSVLWSAPWVLGVRAAIGDYRVSEGRILVLLQRTRMTRCLSTGGTTRRTLTPGTSTRQVRLCHRRCCLQIRMLGSQALVMPQPIRPREPYKQRLASVSSSNAKAPLVSRSITPLRHLSLQANMLSVFASTWSPAHSWRGGAWPSGAPSSMSHWDAVARKRSSRRLTPHTEQRRRARTAQHKQRQLAQSVHTWPAYDHGHLAQEAWQLQAHRWAAASVAGVRNEAAGSLQNHMDPVY